MDINALLADRFPFLNITLLQARIAWSIRLRWLAVIGFFLATFSANYLLDLPLPYDHIWKVLLVLFLLNLIYYVILKVVKEFSFFAELVFLTLHILIDLVILTYLVHLTGGIENPIYLFYIFHVVLSSILLPRWIPYIIATIVVALFSTLVYLEYSKILYHYSVFESASHQNEVLNYLTLIIFTITVYVSSYICTNFMRIFRESKREIDHLYKQLSQADKQKTQFFTYASHELKAPIIAIKSSIDGVLANYYKSLEERPLNVLKRASARSNQMLNIIKELLELTRNRSLLPKNNYEKIDVNKILNDIIQNEYVTALEQNITIETDFEKTDPLVFGKADDFLKVFGNLITNAIRYNKLNGSVFVTSKIKDGKLNIEIKDTGIGIESTDLSKVFSEFYRAENAKKLINFGTGLGLSLVKQIIDNYGGEIKAESELEKGTAFQVILPLANP